MHVCFVGNRLLLVYFGAVFFDNPFSFKCTQNISLWDIVLKDGKQLCLLQHVNFFLKKTLLFYKPILHPVIVMCKYVNTIPCFTKPNKKSPK